jgi:hypothetical protein
MDDALHPSPPLSLLACIYRERRSGVLSIGSPDAPLRLLLRDGQVVGLGPVPTEPPPAPPMPGPDDSARIRLERVLNEVGIRSRAAKKTVVTPALNLRGQLLKALADGSQPATFEEGTDSPSDVAETAGATEPLILEAVRQMGDAGIVREALGDLDRRLVATAAMAEERTLTLTEGYLLSRIDGVTSARQVLQLVPLDPDETERTLLGLVLTGRIEYRAAPSAPPVPDPEVEATPLIVDLEEPEPVAERSDGETEEAGEAELDTPPEEAFPELLPVAPEESWPQADAGAQPSCAEPGPEILARRREILEIFQSLPMKNHFEVLGVEPGCTDAEVKRAYTSLAKRFHPDVHRDPRIEDLHDILEAIFIRVGEAWEVLGDARSRATYEARFGVAPRRPQVTTRQEPTTRPEPPTRQDSTPAPPRPQPPPPPNQGGDYIPPEDILFKARLLLSQARYWEVIHVLEGTIPHMEERRHQHKGQILLARAYAKNPNWVRRAEETLQLVVREDPMSADAHYELGLLYKAGGLTARAQAMFRRVLELRPEHREAAAELGPGDGPGGGLLKRLFGRGKAS